MKNGTGDHANEQERSSLGEPSDVPGLQRVADEESEAKQHGQEECAQPLFLLRKLLMSRGG